LFFKGTNKSTVWYNVPAFTKAGVKPPATWNDLKSAASTLRDSGTTPFAISAGDGWTLTDWFENIYLRTAGADKYDKLVRHEIPWTDDSVKTALRTFAEILSDRSLMLGNPASLQFTDAVDAVFGPSARAAIVYEADFVPGVTDIAKKAKPHTDYDELAFPSIKGSSPAVVAGGDTLVMFQSTPQAKALLKFLASSDAAAIWAREGGFSSPNKKVDASVYPNDISRRVATELANAKVVRYDASDLAPTELGGDVPGSEWHILQDFVKSPADVDGTARRLEEVARKAYT